MGFPFLQNLPEDIGNKFYNVGNLWDKGPKPYIAYRSGAQWTTAATVGNEQWKTFEYDNAAGKRHPVAVTGLEVKASGANGTLRKAEVTIQFPSYDYLDMEPWKDFFRIGNTAAVVWGWTYKGSNNGNIDEAGKVFNNVKNWRDYVSSKGYEHEILVGLMTNFEVTLNTNLTVSVVFHITSPNELPGTLKLSNSDDENRGSFASDDKHDKVHKVLNALNFSQDNVKLKNLIKAHSINYDLPWLDFTYGNSEEPYTSVAIIIEAICKNFKDIVNPSFNMTIDISNAVARGHQHMISISENVIFPNAKAPGFDRRMDKDGSRMVVPIISDLQDLTLKQGETEINFPNTKPILLTSSEGNITFPAYTAGFIKNIYMQCTWVEETLKTCDTISDWIEKLCDEINYASCGLMDLHFDEGVKSDGKQMATIVDLNLTPPAEETKVFSLNPRKQGSGITEISLTTDMPKQLAAQAVLGGNAAGNNLSKSKAGGNEAQNLFSKKEPDALLTPFKEEQSSIEAKESLAKSGKKNPTAAEIKAEEEKLKQQKEAEAKKAEEDASDAGFFDKIINTVVTNVANLFNAPAEAQVKIITKPGDFQQWKLEGYNGTGGAWNWEDGKGGKSVFPIFKNRNMITNIINGKDATAPSSFDSTSFLTNCEIEIKAIGFGGLKNGYKLQVEGMPFGLASNGFFQLTTISHTVDSTKWEVTCKAKWRVKRKNPN